MTSRPDVNPSDLSDVVAEAASRGRRGRATRWRAARGGLRRVVAHHAVAASRGARQGRQRGPRPGRRARRPARARGGQDAARGAAARSSAPGRSSSTSPARSCSRTATLLDSVRPGVEVSVTREPIGVVSVITPWNFPIAIPAWKIAPALAFGNTVVFKPAELVPGSAWELVDILNRAGLPAGALNLVLGRGSVVGPVLTDRPARQRRHLHRLGRHRPRHPRRRRAARPQGAARARRQEPARRRRRRRPRHRGGGARAGRLRLDRPALHGVVVRRRHRRDPRPASIDGGAGAAVALDAWATRVPRASRWARSSTRRSSRRT